MEYINKVNWKRTNRKYYRVFIHYTDNYGYKRRVTCNYNVSQNIKKTSKLGRILKLRADTRLSLFQIKYCQIPIISYNKAFNKIEV